MAQSNDEAEYSTAATSEVRTPREQRPRSLKSWRSRSRTSRSRSRPHSPDSHLHRIYSSGFHDDNGTYVTDLDRETVPNVALAGETESSAAPSPPEEKREEEEEVPEDVETEDFEPESNGAAGVSDDRNADLEKGQRPGSLKRQQTNKSSRSYNASDPNYVTWDGPDDPENPKNWATKRKWAAVLVVSSFTFISPVSSTMVAPALETMSRDLGISDQVVSQMLLSIFLLAYAVGPLFLGPLSEVYGRVPVLQLANLFFLIFNLVYASLSFASPGYHNSVYSIGRNSCGFAQTGAQMLVFRFLAGLGGSAPLAIGGGILGDCFTPETRGKAIGIYSLAPLIGPAVGPIAGGFVTQNTTWRWVFWAVTIADGVIQVLGIFFLQETWAPKLLELKAKKLRKETGNQELYSAKRESTLSKLKTSSVRPFVMLFTQPAIIVFAIYMAYLYGLVYLVISSFPSLYTSPDYYNQSTQIGSLHYISLALGYFLGAQITARVNDWLYRRLKRRNNNVGKPEFRIPMMIPCATLLPVGLFWYGWSAEARVFWIMPDIGALLLAGATICGYFAIQTYVIDTYTKYAASAVAAVTALRSLAAFGFPLFAPAMYDALGYGWGNSLLAFVAIAIGIPAPWGFWRYGAALRARSKYAAG